MLVVSMSFYDTEIPHINIVGVTVYDDKVIVGVMEVMVSLGVIMVD